MAYGHFREATGTRHTDSHRLWDQDCDVSRKYLWRPYTTKWCGIKPTVADKRYARLATTRARRQEDKRECESDI